MKVIPIKQCTGISQGLRNIADEIDEGVLKTDDCTLVMNGEVFHLGTHDDSQSAVEAVFNMAVGIVKIAGAPTFEEKQS